MGRLLNKKPLIFLTWFEEIGSDTVIHFIQDKKGI